MPFMYYVFDVYCKHDMVISRIMVYTSWIVKIKNTNKKQIKIQIKKSNTVNKILSLKYWHVIQYNLNGNINSEVNILT